MISTYLTCMTFKSGNTDFLKILGILRNSILGCAFYFFLIACSSKDQKINIPSIKIDLVDELSIISFSDLVNENVEIVSFQNFDSYGNPIYFNNINRLAFSGGEYYLLDYVYGQNLMVFDRDGNFNQSIGFRGDGPGGYLQPMDFKIQNKEIQILDIGKILSYDLEGNYIRQIKIPSFIANGFGKFSDGYAFIGAGIGTDNLILTNDQLDVQNSFFPYHTRAFNTLLVNPIFENFEGKTIYRRFLNDTLFQIDDFERPRPYLYFDFKQNKSNYIELLDSENLEQVVQASRSNYCNIYSYYETQDYKFLVFSLQGERWNFIYSNLSRKSKLFRQSNLKDNVTFDPNMMPVGVVENKFVLKANPGSVLSGIEVFQGSNKSYQKLKQLNERIDPEGNLILFLVEFNF